MITRILCFIPLAILSCAEVLMAQEGPDIAIRNIEFLDHGLLSLVATVNDPADKPLRDLNVANFELTIDQKPVRILSVREAGTEQGLWVVLAIDVSGSVQGKPLNDAKIAAQAFLQSLSEKDHAALVSFETDVKKVSEFTTDKDKLSYLVNRLEAGKETSLYEAIYDCIMLTAPIPSYRKAIVVLSDGEDTHSRVSLDDCLKLVNRSPVPVYTIAFGSKIKPVALRTTLGRLSKITGGKSFYAPTSDDLGKLYQTILETLKSEYILNAEFPLESYDGKQHSVTLDVKLPYGQNTVHTSFLAPRSTNNEFSSQQDLTFIILILAAFFFTSLFIGLCIFLGFKIRNMTRKE